MLGEIWTFAVAAIFMAAVLVPLEFLVIDASSRGTVLGILLLCAEGLLGGLLYIGAVRVLDPSGFRELIGLVRRLLRRGGDEEPEEEPPADAVAAAAGDTPTQPSIP
jgi:hypothetical protein